MRKICIAAVCVALCVLVGSRTANCMPEFKKAFDEKYTKDNDNKEFKDAVKKEGCFVCHVRGKNKKERNAYGNALAELIEGDAQQRVKDAPKADQKKVKAELVEELKKAFEKVEEMKIDPDKEDSETYGARLKDNKLPVEPSASDSKDGEKEEAEEM